MTKPKRETNKGIVVYVPEELHALFKKACIDAKRSQKDVMREFIEEFSAPEEGPTNGSEKDSTEVKK